MPPNSLLRRDRESTIGVFVVADVRFYEEGLAQALDADARFAVAGTASGVQEAIARIACLERQPEVALLDIAMPHAQAAADALRRALPDLRLIALAVREVDADVLEWAEGGVAGLVERSASLEDLMQAVVSVAGGDAVCSSQMAGTLLRRVRDLVAEPRPPAAPAATLTSREQQIAAMLARGLSNKEIANDLCIGLPTVKNHVHNILEKLKVRRRSEVAARVEAAPSRI